MKKSFGYVVAAPIITIGVMYMAKEVKKEASMTNHFVYRIRTLQETVMGTGYGRSAHQVPIPETQTQGEGSNKNIKGLYDSIKSEQKMQTENKVNQMKEKMPGDQPRIRNASPFYKDQQA